MAIKAWAPKITLIIEMEQEVGKRVVTLTWDKVLRHDIVADVQKVRFRYPIDNPGIADSYKWFGGIESVLPPKVEDVIVNK